MFKTFLFTNILFPFQNTNDDRSPNYLCILFVFVVVFIHLVVIQFTQLYSLNMIHTVVPTQYAYNVYVFKTS